MRLYFIRKDGNLFKYPRQCHPLLTSQIMIPQLTYLKFLCVPHCLESRVQVFYQTL